MANQYIPDEIAELLKKEAVKATKATGRPVNKAEVCKVLILKGLKDMNQADWKDLLTE